MKPLPYTPFTKANMKKIITPITLAILIIGGIISWNFMPESRFESLPSFVQLVLVICSIIFSTLMFVGYLFDSGIPQRLFKKK
jgi:hypothetical protein